MISTRDANTSTFLRSVPVFQDLKGPSLELMFEFLEEHNWAVGDAICTEGDLGRTMYIIREGEVEILRRSTRGNVLPLVRLGPGECFGEMTLVELQPRSATCIVRKKAVTYSVTNLDLWNLYKRDHFAYTIVLQNICRMLSRRLRKADARVVELIDTSKSGPVRPVAAPKKAGASSRPSKAMKAKKVMKAKPRAAPKVSKKSKRSKKG
jgi:CRP-like cAMP-binding protein